MDLGKSAPTKKCEHPESDQSITDKGVAFCVSCEVEAIKTGNEVYDLLNEVDDVQVACKDFSAFVQRFGEPFWNNVFAESVASTIHRTVQQKMMNLVIQLLIRWAKCKTENQYDLRNEATVNMAAEIVAFMESKNMLFTGPWGKSALLPLV